jgi:hypothetical protein
VNVTEDDGRLVLQADTSEEADLLGEVKEGVARAAGGLAFYTLDTPDYDGLDVRDPGDLGEKALVVSWSDA